MIGTVSLWAHFEDQVDQLKEIKDLSAIVILGEMEFYYDKIAISTECLAQVVNYSFQKKVPLYYVTGLSSKDSNCIQPDNQFYKKYEVEYWPTFWFSYSFARMNRDYIKPFNDELEVYVDKETIYKDYKHTFLSMFNMPHIHRCKLIDMFAKHNLINDNKISWRMTSQYIFDYWKENKLIIDQPEAESVPIGLKREQAPACYKDCFMQVVTESDGIDKHTISMSTTVPLFFNKPFLTLGKHNYMEYLESFGFVRYDEIFDYSFDKIEDVGERAEALALEIKRIDSQRKNWNKMYNQIYDKLMYNKKKAISIAIDYSKFPDMWMKVAKQDYFPEQRNGELYPIFFLAYIKKLHEKYKLG